MLFFLIFLRIFLAEHLVNIRILTMNRPNSLNRLLNSLANAFYSADEINLEIFIDALPKNNTSCNKTIEIAKNFLWEHGRKKIIKNTKNLGHIKQWFQRPLSIKPFFIIEDDLILSPYFYSVVKKALKNNNTSNNKDVLGFSLQKLRYVIVNDNCKNYDPDRCIKKNGIPRNSVYFLNQFSPWAPFVFSEKWNELINYYEQNEKKSKKVIHCIPNAISNLWYNASDTFAQYFMYEKGYFLMFFNTINEISHNFLEKGLHFSGKKMAMNYTLFNITENELVFERKYFFDVGFNRIKNTDAFPSNTTFSNNNLNFTQKCKVRY